MGATSPNRTSRLRPGQTVFANIEGELTPCWIIREDVPGNYMILIAVGEGELKLSSALRSAISELDTSALDDSQLRYFQGVSDAIEVLSLHMR